MPPAQQMFGRPHHRVRDSIDIRQERLRNQSDSHAHTMICADVRRPNKTQTLSGVRASGPRPHRHRTAEQRGRRGPNGRGATIA
ncbi:hypothetical protein Ato02nite_046890 [Paractinoplanes toevensis]|uniref:Uncharacterized protein n=1 Tax=Paractinoplanes toevensis TaxID=571911 RepID=A0A919TDM3_9ACTN|nr:hypothetical protein Ato02nite_046890 [Actinoplanes toevensis]